jgi:8-oxo-dGTP pyrophosphatase MutT (NUDIX family)
MHHHDMEKILSQHILHQGKVLTLHQAEIDFANGTISRFEYMSFSDWWESWVIIVALDERKEIFLVEQYQVWVDRRILVLPRGGGNHGESLAEKANTELQEEIWMRAKNLILLKEMDIFPWYIQAKSFLFLGTELEPCQRGWDESETIHIHKIPFDMAVEKVMKWEITDARTIAGILFVERYLKDKDLCNPS